MQALILAAGFGKRLQPLTNSKPKCLIEVNGVSLLVNTLNQLANRNISEVVIVIGHMRRKIIEKIGHEYKNMRITYVENPIYEQTNNVYSFYLAKNYIHDDTIMLECDIFYERELIDTVLKGEGQCNILVSRYNGETMDGTVISADEKNIVKALITKKDQRDGFDYSDKFKTVNVYKFSRDFIVNKFLPAVELYVHTQSSNSYYELVLGSLVYFGNSDIRIIDIDENKWCEIDDIRDLERAQQRFCSIADDEIQR